MIKTQKVALAILIQAIFITPAFASEQSDAKGFIEDAEGSVLFRTGFIDRDLKGVDAGKDTRSTAQTAIFDLNSGFTQGIVGLGIGVIGDWSFKLGSNHHAGNQMIPIKNKLANNEVEPYNQWTRGGANIKARFSNTTLTYGTQVLDIPIFASNTARLGPEYFTGVLATSREIKDLELIFGKFTKDQMSDQISTDGNDLKRAYVWGAKYKINDAAKVSYYGLDSKDRLKRHYINTNYQQALANNSSLTYDFSGYYTKWNREANNRLYSYIGSADDSYHNSIWAVSATYATGPHSVMLAYQQNDGNVGYDYGQHADGFQSIYLPNSYMSDFIGNKEKSAQIQYHLDFSNYGIAGLNWTSAYVYGWNIHTNTATEEGGKVIYRRPGITNAKEREFFNQLKYTVQSGFAKDASLRLRYSHYRADKAYSENYLPDTNEWRIFLDIPVKLF
ncbi:MULTISPECIES: OprD family outer membrane porin [unclassified Acinetobacter]|uniref:OprD family outer membrane porin n=1 Tax=unclassified Acinetobacter TaxID=196816 RepID=UPI002934581C|nr:MULTISPECIES: OprD family outer membrane porin [unclassified Acinetobacter]WOE30690.1 OprD family outer membrane porin [Acinetobacter sp. SAAs470]WOE38883.1 OprD family outer membrane porin [Acinetobacter sp. SAAs474]